MNSPGGLHMLSFDVQVFCKSYLVAFNTRFFQKLEDRVSGVVMTVWSMLLAYW